MRTVSIYIDTSIKGPRRRDGSCQYIIAFQAANGQTADMGGRIQLDAATENRLTLLGLESALRRLREPCCLHLHLECRYVASVLQGGWYRKWKMDGWRNAKGKPVADADLWQSIEYLLDGSEFEVRLQQEHPYRRWMRMELSRSGRKE